MWLTDKYIELEKEVHDALINEIETSKTKSDFVSTKAIKVDVFDYVELIYINNKLVFIDNTGLHYSVYSDCMLEDLIDILNNL